MLTDMLSRTVPSAIMRGAQCWVIAVVLQSLLLGVSCGHHRRSMASPSTLPLSKGGWRPVINSGLPGYGAFVAAPLHAPSYKIPVPVMDSYPSSSRPVGTREAPQGTREAPRASSPYPLPPRPSTHRSLVASPSPASPAPNQPIHTYYNPFSVPNSLTHYNFVQSYPVEKIIIRNPHNPYAARPVFTKHQNKFKQNYHNQMIQQLNNIQPIQFGAPMYPTSKPHDVFGKPVEGYARPGDFQKKPQPTSGTEIYKQEVYKLPDSDPAPQPVNQLVKTAQQQSNVAKPPTDNQYQTNQHQTNQHQTNQHQTNQYQQYPQYQFKDEKFAPIPSSVLGPFNNFGVQTVKGRDPFYQPTKTTYIPTLPPKHTVFNSYSYSPHFKSTVSVSQFPSTTPKLQSTLNHIQFGLTSDYRPTSDQPAKIPNNVKTEPNTGKVSFKPSPQDPFIKYQVSTYNPNAQTSTVGSSYNNYQTQSPQNAYYNIPTFSFENKKHKIHDSLGSSVNQQQSSVIPLKKPEPDAPKKSAPHRPTYEVTEVYEQDDIHTQASPNPWVTPETFDFLSNQQKPGTEDSVTSPDYTNDDAYRKETLPPNDLSEEYAIVTESEKNYENSLHYDSLDTQSIKPVKEEFEPIGKHKLKDYYYKVTTPSYDETTHHKRYKNRPTESPEQEQDLTTVYNSVKSETPPDALPTLPPNKHFKRPSAPDSIEKDKLKKRLKTRRRRPPGTNSNNNKEQKPSTESNEGQPKRQRVRIPKPKPHDSFTTPTLNNDVASSAVPTITPTTPTTPKKKAIHRHRPHLNTHEKVETSSRSTTTESGDDKESPIMKIAIRPHHLRSTTASYDSSSSEAPDYSHKQDEKDTPTSDIAVNLSDNQRNKPESGQHFSFHRDVKPIDGSVEPIRYSKETTTDTLVLPLETTTSSSEEDITTTTAKILKPRLKTKYDSSNRPKFSVKDYRSRLSSTTTSTTERSSESHAPKLRYPQRRPLDNKNKNENETAERKKFVPKDPRHKSETTSTASEQTEEPHPTRHPYKSRQSTADTTETTGTTQKISSRIRNGVRRRPAEETTENANPTTVHLKRPNRKKVKDSELGESVQDVAVTETTHYERDDATSERTRSESAIMKIAKDDKKHHVNEALDHIFEHSKRVSDLTLAASKDYSTPGKFKTISPNSRRIPNYFTIATDDPILPIEAFFPQLNQKKES